MKHLGLTRGTRHISVLAWHERRKDSVQAFGTAEEFPHELFTVTSIDRAPGAHTLQGLRQQNVNWLYALCFNPVF